MILSSSLFLSNLSIKKTSVIVAYPHTHTPTRLHTMAKLKKDKAFESIVKGTEKSKLLIIAHGFDVSRSLLLRYLQSNWSTERAQLLAIDSFNLNELGMEESKTIVKQNRPLLKFESLPRMKQLLQELGLELDNVGQFDSDTLVIDSLNPLLIEYTNAEIRNFFKCLKANFRRVIATVSAQLPTQRQLVILREVSISYAQLDRLSPYESQKFQLKLMHKRSSSKIRFDVSQFEQRVQFDLTAGPTLKVLPDEPMGGISCTETSDLPFNLRLAEEEDEEEGQQRRKEQVQPYIR